MFVPGALTHRGPRWRRTPPAPAPWPRHSLGRRRFLEGWVRRVTPAEDAPGDLYPSRATPDLEEPFRDLYTPSCPDPTSSTGAPPCPSPCTTPGSQKHPCAPAAPALTPGHLGLGGGVDAGRSGSCGPRALPLPSESARAQCCRPALQESGEGAEHSGNWGPCPRAAC